MDTLRLNPRLRIPLPEFWRLIAVGLLCIFAATLWWIVDLWQVAIWSSDQLRTDDGPRRGQLFAFSTFAGSIAIISVALLYVATAHGWHLYEWAMPQFVLSFLYCVATYIRLSR